MAIVGLCGAGDMFPLKRAVVSREGAVNWVCCIQRGAAHSRHPPSILFTLPYQAQVQYLRACSISGMGSLSVSFGAQDRKTKPLYQPETAFSFIGDLCQ